MTKHLEQENGALKKILIGNLLTNTNVISENPLLSGKTFYSINYSTKYKDVMTQLFQHLNIALNFLQKFRAFFLFIFQKFLVIPARISTFAHFVKTKSDT